MAISTLSSSLASWTDVTRRSASVAVQLLEPEDRQEASALAGILLRAQSLDRIQAS